MLADFSAIGNPDAEGEYRHYLANDVQISSVVSCRSLLSFFPVFALSPNTLFLSNANVLTLIEISTPASPILRLFLRVSSVAV